MGFTLADLVQVNRSVAAAFDEREQRPWGAETLVIELSKQVGDLARAVLTAEHYYLPDRENDPKYGGNGARIANELADILYCVMRLADHYDLDLWHDLRHHHACFCRRASARLSWPSALATTSRPAAHVRARDPPG